MKHCMGFITFILLFTGCGPSRYQLTIDDYMAEAPKVSLGMSIEEVKRILKLQMPRILSTV